MEPNAYILWWNINSKCPPLDIINVYKKRTVERYQRMTRNYYELLNDTWQEWSQSRLPLPVVLPELAAWLKLQKCSIHYYWQLISNKQLINRTFYLFYKRMIKFGHLHTNNIVQK